MARELLVQGWVDDDDLLEGDVDGEDLGGSGRYDSVDVAGSVTL